MGRHTKLTASQHAEIRATVAEREFLTKRVNELQREIRQTKRCIAKLQRTQLAYRYGVNPRTIERVLSGDPYGSIKPEPTISA